MKPISLHTKYQENIGKYIPEFPTDQVILQNYFYFTPNNFLTPELYSDEELSLILQLTDTEYALLVQNYIHGPQEVNISSDEAKIAELEGKLAKSRDFEDKTAKLETLKKEFEELSKNLSSVKEIQNKYDESLKEYKQFDSLTKYNLNKIHEDLVKIINDISNLEQKILDHKGEEIRETYTRTSYDKGKIGLSAGLFIGILLLGFILKLLQTPTLVISIGVGVGIFLCALILYSAKVETEYGGQSLAPAGESLDGIKSNLELLKQKRTQILQLVGIPSTDEFFNTKAKLSSLQKSMAYLEEQKNRAVEGADYELLLNREKELSSEINDISAQISDTSVLLKPEEYLSIRREVDQLRLNSNQAKQNSNLTPDQIKEKLISIRKELQEKLPEFCNVLKNTLQTSSQKISEYISNLCSKHGILEFQFDDNLGNFSELSLLQKMILEISFFKIIYEQDFVFIIPGSKSWEIETQATLGNILNDSDIGCSFYLVD